MPMNRRNVVQVELWAGHRLFHKHVQPPQSSCMHTVVLFHRPSLPGGYEGNLNLWYGLPFIVSDNLRG